MTIDVLTHEFEREHGRTPRGRGGWAFCLVSTRQHDYLDYVIWATGTYREARAAAVAVVKGQQPVAAGWSAERNVVLSFGKSVAEAVASGHADALYVCS